MGNTQSSSNNSKSKNDNHELYKITTTNTSSTTTNTLNYINFPILTHQDTISFVQRNKIMVILKGLPGSGKTFTSEQLKRVYPNAIICSAYKYFLDGNDVHDSRRLCQKDAENAAQRNERIIIIDNDNIKCWEVCQYTRICRKYNYFVLCLETQTPWRFDVSKLITLSSRSSILNENILNRYVKEYESPSSIYCAWFFNEADSRKISDIAEGYLEKAFLEIDNFSHQFRDYSRKKLILHVTACYGNNLQTKKYMGRCYPIHIIGYVITPDTFGARVKLTEEQLELWDIDDNEQRPKSKFLPDHYNKPLPEIFNNNNEEEDRIQIVNQEEEEEEKDTFSPKGSRAHITIGTDPKIKPVITGFDLMDIVYCEKHYKNDNIPTYTLSDGSVLKCYGNERWVIYPKTKLIAESFFTAWYK